MTDLAAKSQKPRDCKCGQTSISPVPDVCETVITYPSLTPITQNRNLLDYEDDESSASEPLQTERCTPVNTHRNSFRPFHLAILAYPRYQRPAGCDVLASYNRVCEDMHNTTCLGFINSRDNEIIWGEFKSHLPLPKGRITHLPAKRRIHFNNYFIRKCTPETAESWKVLSPQPLLEECDLGND